MWQYPDGAIFEITDSLKANLTLYETVKSKLEQPGLNNLRKFGGKTGVTLEIHVGFS